MEPMEHCTALVRGDEAARGRQEGAGESGEPEQEPQRRAQRQDPPDGGQGQRGQVQEADRDHRDQVSTDSEGSVFLILNQRRIIRQKKEKTTFINFLLH